MGTVVKVGSSTKIPRKRLLRFVYSKDDVKSFNIIKNDKDDKKSVHTTDGSYQR